MHSIIDRLAEELAAHSSQVEAAVALLDEGATVPFIARYRKEVTGGLDDIQLRQLEERLGYLRELEDRRGIILRSVDEQGKLSDELRAQLETATTKQQLEDLYLPYKPKRRTKAQIAREAGLEPLADLLLAEPERDPSAEAAAFVDTEKGVADAAAALEGARQILMERFAEEPDLAGRLRERLWEQGVLVAHVMEGKEAEGAKFSDYFDYREPIAKVPSHRALALFRGRNQGILSLELLPGEGEDPDADCRHQIAARFGIADRGRAADAWLLETVRKAWRVKLLVRLELDLKGQLLEAAEAEAIRVFAMNLKDLLLAAPAGRLTTIGLDPGLRTGVKVAVIDTTGRVAATGTIYPHAPRQQWDQSIATLAELAKKFQVTLVSIGNGTASRETDRLVRDLIKRHPELGLRSMVVSEAGASVYSASEFASRELPEMDVSLRGAVSIARRLQDPLAELVKIDPKAIGVGQYQHDVNQSGLARSLEAVVEDCVNAVGVELNTASAPLLSRVSGLNNSLAENIIRYREEAGAFASRKQLLKVPRLGPKAFEQCAGFLRIKDSEEALDGSAVHPEAYPLARRIAEQAGKPIRALIGDSATLRRLKPQDFVDERFGEPTVRDILLELEKPGRDPRPEFRAASFMEGVETLADLKPGMQLEGTVTNVTNFGAFVDVGVHQDGLVHVSMLADRFVRDPHEVVHSGQLVKVRVLEVDLERKRIALSMRQDNAEAGVGRGAGASNRAGGGAKVGAKAGAGNRRDATSERAPRGTQNRSAQNKRPTPAAVKPGAPPAAGGTMADAFAKARKG
ncbi:Tex family protein [Rhabdochromatium marinum]|uniref:Tex family protein n=1 Tax=Rhabdochromatium marinum TaxID=48729 RepID=UPI0019065824|nr:Tex family protein [Rhabdochromatium marinum]MBK1648441.1 RNA-binding transcriptional accessory protein [Rhabdochromatium marinum]